MRTIEHYVLHKNGNGDAGMISCQGHTRVAGEFTVIADRFYYRRQKLPVPPLWGG